MALISIIVPAFNAAETIQELLASVSSGVVEHDKQIIVVDDGSTDGTHEAAERFAESNVDARATIVIERLPQNRGAGACRNVGLQRASGDYVLFLDADDVLAPNAIDNALRLDAAKRADFILFPYHYVIDTRERVASGMLKEDKKIWEDTLARFPRRLAVVRDASKLALFTNYPWNKLIQRSFAERINLQFSEIPVNNDIAAHWQLYTNAKSVYLHDDESVFHFVHATGSQITRVFDERRFFVFEALDQTEDYIFSSETNIMTFYESFMRFKINLLLWIYRRLPDFHYEEFYNRVQNLYRNLDDDAVRFLAQKSSDLASSSVILSTNPRAFFSAKG